MGEPIEEVYFNWLYSKVASISVPPTPALTYITLLRDLHQTEFIWLLPGDDNRAEEGLELRNEFLKASRVSQDPPWFDVPCSVLEMLIAFSNRAAYQTEISAREWFWILLNNLGIGDLSDNCLGITQTVNSVLDTFIWRTYDVNGEGGMFPLSDPSCDQRHLEIWYQFCEYVVDQDLF